MNAPTIFDVFVTPQLPDVTGRARKHRSIFKHGDSPNVPQNARMCTAGGTETTEGFIPHHQHPDGYCMPVKLDASKAVAVGAMKNPLPPLKVNGKFVWVRPGGEAYLA